MRIHLLFLCIIDISSILCNVIYPSSVCVIGDVQVDYDQQRDPRPLMGTYKRINASDVEFDEEIVDTSTPMYEHSYFTNDTALGWALSQDQYLFKVTAIGWALSETLPVSGSTVTAFLTCFQDSLFDCTWGYNWFWGYNTREYPISTFKVSSGSCSEEMCLKNLTIQTSPGEYSKLDGEFYRTFDNETGDQWINIRDSSLRWYSRVTTLNSYNWVYGRSGSDRIACAPGYVDMPLFCTTYVYAGDNPTLPGDKFGIPAYAAGTNDIATLWRLGNCDPTAAPTHPPTHNTEAPTESPTQAPTRYPTITNAYSKIIDIKYELKQLTDPNIILIFDDINVHMPFIFDLISILETSYVELSKLYADTDDEEIQYRQFEITTDYNNIQQNYDNKSVVIVSEIHYEKPEVANTITFISGKRAFINYVTPIIASSDYFGNDAITFAATIIENNAPDTDASFDYILIGLLSFIGIMTIISILAFINNKRKSSKIDDSDWFVMIVIGFQIFDLVSDILLCTEILAKFGDDTANTLLFISGIGSAVFIVVPYFINISIASQIKAIVSGNTAAMIYFEQRAALFITLVVFCGSVYPVLALVSSRLFALDVFNSGLTAFELRRLSKYKLFGTILAENIPQLACQLIYISYLKGIPSSNTILSFIASVLSIVGALLSYSVNRKSLNCHITQYDLTLTKLNRLPLTKDEKHNISENKEKKNRWRKELATAIHTTESSIELGYVTTTSYGFIVHVIHYSFKDSLESMHMNNTSISQVNTNTRAQYDTFFYETLAKQFIEKLYHKNEEEVSKCFCKHFGFNVNAIKIKYAHKIDYNDLIFSSSNKNVLMAVEMQNMHRKDSLSVKIDEKMKIQKELAGTIKYLLRNNTSKSEIKTRLQQNYSEQEIDEWFLYLNVQTKVVQEPGFKEVHYNRR